jgi:hypothetical protein
MRRGSKKCTRNFFEKPCGKWGLRTSIHRREDDIVAYLLKARTVEAEKQPLLGNARKQQ